MRFMLILAMRHVCLTHSLSGYPPYHPDAGETIPLGAGIMVADYDHTETDALVEYAGHRLIVDKETLSIIEDPS